MAIEIRKAERRQAKLRIGIFGPSGSGKTMSSLKLAHGLVGDWNKVCLIDTENRSAELYSHLGPYSVITLIPPFNPEKYIEAIKAAEDAGFQVIIIDSITHEWAGQGGILELADTLGKDAKSSFTVWGKLTPRHNKFIDAILQSNVHVICCGRSKQEYALNQTEKNGRTVSVPEKVGLKAVTRDGFDYEMTISFELAITHLATSTKDRTSIFQDKPEHVINEETGEKLKAWNEQGTIAPVDTTAQKQRISHHLTRLHFKLVGKSQEDKAFHANKIVKNLTGYPLEPEYYTRIITALNEYQDPENAQFVYEAAPVASKVPSNGGGGGSAGPTPGGAGSDGSKSSSPSSPGVEDTSNSVAAQDTAAAE